MKIKYEGINSETCTTVRHAYIFTETEKEANWVASVLWAKLEQEGFNMKDACGFSNANECDFYIPVYDHDEYEDLAYVYKELKKADKSWKY